MNGICNFTINLKKVIFLISLLSASFHLMASSEFIADTGKWETLFTNLPGQASSAVPGLMGASFAPGTGTTHFDRIYVSPNGNYALSADTDLPANERQIIIVNGNVVVRQGTPTPWAMSENFGLFDTKLGINDAGTIVFSTNTDGATTSDEYVIRRASDASFTVLAREGDNASPPLSMGTNWGSTFTTPVISSSGQMGFIAVNLLGTPASNNEALIFDNAVIAQKGITIPPGQSGSEFIENFDSDDFWINEDGSKYMYSGDLTGSTSTDNVVVVDGNVVLQEGSIIPGSGFISPIDVLGITGVHMDPGGNWYARGNNDDENDWVVRNGTVIAKVGDPIFAGATEVWDDVEFANCFFLHVGNKLGEYVLGGVTDSTSATNGILVFYGLGGANVIAREGDPIDIDGNGLYDDDAYFDTFGNDDLGAHLLSDEGVFYIVATIENGLGQRIGQGVFRMSCHTGLFEITYTTSNRLQFDDPCNCDNAVSINNIFYFGDTLLVMYPTGADISFVASGSSDFYDANGLPIADGTAFNEVSPGVYELPFFKRDGVQPVVFVSINGGVPIQVDPSALEVCSLSDCPTLIPTLGQWSLICIMLMSLIFGALVLAQRRNVI